MRSLFSWVAALLALLSIAAPTAHADALEQDPFAGDALAAAADVPEDFVEETAFDNLLAPASIAFSPDGRVFVGQLDGVIKLYDSVEDTTPSVYADLSENVAWHNDRGLMAIELDPAFTSGRPYLYASYTYDAAVGGTAPRWNDNCPDPPGAERDGCVVSGRVSKILPDGSELPLIKDEWCQQYPSHSLGDLQFGADGALYITAGDGASYTFADYGQDGSPTNPCGDPGAAVGGNMTPPTAEGGALRSQDARTTGDPTGLDGALLRVDPDTGDPLPDNPGTGDLNARRIVAYGFRNPFRFAFRPGTTDAYVGDVGWLQWEEIDRVPDTTSQVRNYGWPCYEGSGRQSGYEALGLNLCRNLYTAGTAVPPLYTYNHAATVAGEDFPAGSSSISGVTFYEGETFPPAYRGAMFFADYTRNAIWVMFPDANGVPNPATRQVFAEDASTPVDLEMGPNGDLYYADVGRGTIQRIRAINPNQAPTAAFTATPDHGAAPLHVSFDATGSTDPNGDALLYAWDLDGDGAYDDSSSATPERTYANEGMVTVRLRVTDPAGSADTETTELTVGVPPTVTISGPADGSTYRVGDRVDFSGSARRADGSVVPKSELLWTVDLNHCSALVPTNCHVHHMTNYVGVESGFLTYPDHEYPSYVTLTLTATEASGLRGAASVRVNPKTVQLSFNSTPPGLLIGVGGEATAAPFARTVAQGSTVGVAAPPSQSKEGFSYDFGSWSDGGAAAHQFTAPETNTAYSVTYTETPCPVRDGLIGAWSFDEPSGSTAFDTSGRNNPGTISGAARTTAGRFGAALSFDGLNDVVEVKDSNSLDAVGGVTIEGWVNANQLGSSWRTVAMKEQSGGLVYALYAHDGENHTSAHVATPFESRTTGSALPLNTWTHVATTYDGATLRLLVNGEPVSSMPVTGALSVSNGDLHIGGNEVWSEWFSGLIDELRVYDRALTPAEVRVDMTRPITCVSDPQAPVLNVTPGSLAFSGEQGGAAPAAKTLAISNGGAGTLSWTATDDAPWLSVSPGSGSDAGTVTVTPSITSLSPGTYTANVTLSATGAASKVVPVTLTVTAPPPGPALSVTPGTLAFSATQGGSSPAARSLDVANSGGGTLSWTVSDDAAWLAVSPGSGTNAGTITVAPSLGGLTAGTYTATVTVSASGASGSPRAIPVTFTVEPPPQPPVLAVSSSTLAFSATAGAPTVPTQAVNVSNTGGGTLSFTASADVPWLSVSPQSGSAPRTVSVTPSTAGLVPGTYTGTVTIAAPGVSGSPKAVAVTFEVRPAAACTPPAGLVGAWGFDEGTGAAAADASPAGNAGSISGATRTAFGRFGGALSFDGTNDMVTIPDANTLDLTSGLTLSAWVNPTVSNGSWRTVLLKERTGGMSYALYGNTDTSQSGGYIATPLESSAKSVAALPAGAWTHLATTFDGSTLRMFVNGVQVSSRAVSGSVVVGTGALRIGGNAVWSEWYSGLVDEVRVYNRALGTNELQTDMAAPVTCTGPAPQPVLSVTPASLSFSATQGGASPAVKALTIANTGDGTLDWSASENASWLSVTPAGGTLTVTPALGALAAGTYTADVTVTSNGGTTTIPVTFTVTPPPAELAVTPSSLSFSATAGGPDPSSKTLEVSNAGGGTLEWSASADASWLRVGPESGNGADTITVTASLDGLEPGTHEALVTVSGAGTRMIPVTFTVDAAPIPPALQVTPESLSFEAVAGQAARADRTLSIANTGGGTLEWTASDDAAWLSLAPDHGTGDGDLQATVDSDGLGTGTYHAEIVIDAAGAENAPRSIPVTLTVESPPPALEVAPGALSFSGVQGGTSPAAKTLAVSNTGGGTLTFEASETVAWLSLSTAGNTITVTPAIAGLTAGTHTADVSISSNGGTKTIPVTLTVSAPSTAGLVAAYGFEEAAGTTSADSSGAGNVGQIAGATRTTTGRYGRALSFDGINDWMTVNHTDALNLSTGMTLSAWVNPVQVGSAYRTVIGKEMPSGLTYMLYAGDGSGKASGRVNTTGEFGATATANTSLNTWTFLATTWDRTTVRLFVNGVEVASRPLSGTVRTSTGVLRIGGNGIWSEWYRGAIDEVRVYNRALTLPELQGDMGRPVPAAG